MDPLLDIAKKNNLNFCRFDYSGHGESGGNFKEGTVTKWSREAEEIFHKFKTKKKKQYE